MCAKFEYVFCNIFDAARRYSVMVLLQSRPSLLHMSMHNPYETYAERFSHHNYCCAQT